MNTRHIAAYALCAVCGAAVAQTTDLDAGARQQRMDSAYSSWQHGHGTTARHDVAHESDRSAGAPAGASVGESLRQYGHSFVADAKKVPGQMADAGRDLGHSIAGAAREQGHEAKAVAGKAKKSVSGS